MKTRLWNRLSFRLIISISVILICFLAIYTFFLITNLDEYITNNSFKHAYDVSEVIKKSTRYSMLLNRREDVHQIINTIGTEKGVKGIRIYNKQGTIIFSTDSSELNKQVDLTAEACIICHNASVPLTTVSNQDKFRIFTTYKDQRILGLINPIHNEEDCSSASCHAHSSNIQFLGVLDVMVPLNELDLIKTEITKTTIINSAIITVVTAAACGVFIIFLVNMPMRKLSKGMQEVGNGNLNYKISVDSEDELGEMAKRFNEMSSKLNSAYQEIKDWSGTLNIKVQQKNKELKKIYEHITEVEKLTSLGKLSATVAHELNNPLEGILTYSKLISKKLKKLDDGKDYSDLQNFLGLIADESARCGMICKDLLLFSNRGEEHFEPVLFIEVIDRSLALINHHFEINNINIKRINKDKDLAVECDSQKIEQAIVAVLMNAAESMTGEGIVTSTLSREGNNVALRITDEGSGISGNDLPHIFEPFYTTKNHSKGTGLGLSVAYGIINQHHGNIVVENTSIKGTTFKITLPIIQSKEYRNGNKG
jgi:two-component system NtrC family sensor kinase